MERLLPDVPSLRSQIFPEKPPAKQLYLCQVDSVTELLNKIKPHSTCFGLLLAMDARETDTTRIFEVADKTLEMGLVYLCAWGPDCGRVHDIFDEQEVARQLDSNTDNLVMTTWHEHETLENALRFFVHSAFPPERYAQACADWIIAVVGEPSWVQEIRNKIQKVAFGPPAD
jgi:hypothetical protein